MASVTPVSKILPILAVDPVATLAQSFDDRVQQLIKGKEYQAQVVSKLDDGQYAVKLKLDADGKDALIKMDLGKSDAGLTKPGQALLLRYLHSSPTPTFLSLSTASQSAASAADISPTAKLIGNILSQANQTGVTARYEASAVVTQAPHNAQIIAHDLQHAIKTSGLFYESHLHDLVNNNHTLTAIRQEPQNQVSPQLTNLVSQQLTILENQQISWQGQVWPNQTMNLDIYFNHHSDESNQEQQHGRQDTGEDRPIISQMTLDLPNLGKVAATLSLSDGRMRIGFLAEQSTTLRVLKSQLQVLAKSIEKNGQQLDALTVSTHE